ncbi:MAG: hypothetical protein QXM75_04690, partial [Candidatus Diapherotrites archaeon]
NINTKKLIVYRAYMSTLSEREDELRLFLKGIEERIEKFEKIKEQLMNKQDSIKAEMQANDLALVPVKIYVRDAEDLIAEIERHLIELEKFRSYLANELKKVIEEKRMQEVLSAKFGPSVVIEPTEEGFIVKYTDDKMHELYQELKKSREGVSEIKNKLRKA